MRARLIVNSCWLVVWVLAGCNSASSKVDVGPNYTAPAPAGLLTENGVTYERPATPEREQKILSGYPQLAVGQTREEVRALLGAPDAHVATHRRGSDRFEGWYYIYYGHQVRQLINDTDANDQVIQIFFDRADDRLNYAHPASLPGLLDVGQKRE